MALFIINSDLQPGTKQQGRERESNLEAARTMLCAKGLPKKLWAEAVHTAVYVLNRSSKSNEPGNTAFET